MTITVAYMQHNWFKSWLFCDPHIMCYILNIRSYCACIFSIRYVLPNHMLLQIAESLPREMQGILACCNPIPPLVRQNLLAIHRIILEARDQPLVKVNIPLLLIFLSVGIISSVINWQDRVSSPVLGWTLRVYFYDKSSIK